MQRLFFAFPGGLPGCGLLLLRIAVSVTAVFEWHSLPFWPGTPAFVRILAGAFGILALISILVGYLTPIGSSVLAIEIVVLLSLSSFVYLGFTPAGLLQIDLLILSVTVAAVGPGAFSLDARLFGRREMVFPN